MPSFDVVSEIDMHEVTNAVNQASREIDNRFDFKGTNARFELLESVITLHAQADFQLKQMLDILNLKLAKRGVDVACIKLEEPDITGNHARQDAILRQGVDADLARKMVKLIKGSKTQSSDCDSRSEDSRQREEAGRPAVGNRPAQGSRYRFAAAVREFQRLSHARSRSSLRTNAETPARRNASS